MRFLGIILRVIRLEVFVTMFTLQTSFKPLLLGRWGGGGGSKIHLVEVVTVNSKEETFVPIMSKKTVSGKVPVEFLVRE